MMNIEDLQVGDIVEFWYIKYNQQIYANGRVVELKTESNETENNEELEEESNEQDYYRKYRH